MPSVSKPQHVLMQAAAHTKGGFGGVPQTVGQEFSSADRKYKFADGGGTADTYTPGQSSDPIEDAIMTKLSNLNASTNGSSTIGHQFARVGLGLADRAYTGLRDTIAAPGEVMQGKYSASQLPDVAARTGMGIANIGAGFGTAPAGALGFMAPRRFTGEMPKKPYEVINTLSNGHKIGKMNDYPSDNLSQSVNHVLLSPGNETPLLYGRSPEDLIKRGFPDEEHAELLGNIGYARGGKLSYASGGYTPPAPSFGAREAYRQEISPTAGGVIASEVPGRTDHIPLSPAANSFVIPADVLSGIGENNTLAGARIMDEMLHSGPYGIRLPQSGNGNTIPRPPTAAHFAGGGTPHRAPLRLADTSDRKKPNSVPIMAAGGEYIIPPEVVQNHPLLGNGDMERGHAILRSWVIHERKKHIKTLSRLPGPHK